ncbi:hypothetical protein T492DRAFT_933269, partial [Pavlovales sp. CCMP2436]
MGMVRIVVGDFFCAYTGHREGSTRAPARSKAAATWVRWLHETTSRDAEPLREGMKLKEQQLKQTRLKEQQLEQTRLKEPQLEQTRLKEQQLEQTG